MKLRFKKMSSILVGLVLLLGLLAACGGKDGGSSSTPSGGGGSSNSDTPSNADAPTVVVRGLYDITGGTGDVGTPYAEGQAAYFKYLVSKGGFEEVNIDHNGEDYAYDITQAQRIYQAFRDRDNASAIIGWGTGDTEALRQQVATDQLPFVSASYSENLKNIEESPYNFLVAASYSDQGRAILQWIKENHEGPGEPTVALLYNDTAFGRSPVEDIKNYAKEIGGISIVDEQVIEVSATEAQSQLLNMQKANPDYAIINQTWNATATILRDANTLGIETQFFGLNWTAGEGLIELAGDVSEGFIAAITHAFPYEDLPGLAEIEEYLKGEGKTLADVDQKFVQGWSTSKIMAEAIRIAAANAEGDITGADIREALESLNNFDLGGLGANVSFSADNHAGTEELRLGQVKNGKWEMITDYFSHRDY